MIKKSILGLILLLFSVVCVGQTSFTNGGSRGCVNPNYPRNYYCSAMPRYENGVQVGYLAFFFVLNADGSTFQGGQLWIQDGSGTSILAATNFNGSFSATNGYGSSSQAMGPVRVCAGKYGCYYRTGDLGGSGMYTLQ